MKSQLKTTKSRFYHSPTMRFIKKGLVIVSVIGYMAGCTKSSTDNSSATTTIDCSGPAKTYSVDVRPIIQASCATDIGCHGAGSNNGPGELTSYARVFNSRSDIRSAVISGIMPKNGSLTASEKNSIICWIDNGAPEN
jgi:hypothetical protein